MRVLLQVLVVLTVALLASGNAQAAVSLCLSARTEPQEQVGFEKLVRSEVGRHPSHRVVEKDCESRLIVETFETAKVRYLTAQLDGEVPERVTLQNREELAEKLAIAIANVLGNDPVALSQDPARWSQMERMSHSVLVRGTNSFRLELFETLMRTDLNVAFAPGLGLGYARGADQWRIHTRIHLSGWPAALSGDERVLRLASGLDAGVLYEASRRANTTGYLGAGAGLVLLRVEGLADVNDRNSATVVDCVGATLNVRGGIRFLRIFDFDADVFAQANFPLFVTKETDSPLWGETGTYTPYLQLGVGFGF